MTQRPVPSPTSENVIEALGRTGFLLEQRVAREVREAGYSVTTGRAFEDPDQGKSREVDVFGIKRVFGDQGLQVQVIVQLVIECKKSDGPYVVLGRGLNEYEKVKVPYSHTLPVKTVSWIEEQGDGRAVMGGTSPWDWLGLHELPHSPNRDTRKGVQMVRMYLKGGQWKADNDGIFDSLTLPLMKAVDSFRPPRDRSQKPRHAILGLCFPVVVTSGELFYVDGESDSPSAVPVDWVSVERDIKNSSASGNFNMDVVTYPALDVYLTERVASFSEEVGAKIAEAPHKLKQTELDGPPKF